MTVDTAPLKVVNRGQARSTGAGPRILGRRLEVNEPATFRVERDGYAWQSYSSDGGRTWSWPRPTPVWGFPQQLCSLDDDRILMAYGSRKSPFSVRACTSADSGRTYDLRREIVFRHDGADKDLGYPYSIQLRDGRVLTVYYFHRDDTNCYIEAAVYRP